MVKEETIEKYKRYINKTFGCILINDIDLSEIQNNRIYYKCTCLNCNRNLRIRTDGIFRKNYTKAKERVGCTHCLGDWRRKNFIELYKDLPSKDIRDKYNHFKGNAKSRGLKFDLTRDQVIKFCESPCFYCKTERCLGIDRVDNSKGYTIDNCVPCCRCCNKMKMDLEPKFFINQIRKIYNNLETIESSTTISKESTSKAFVDGNGTHLKIERDDDIVLSA